jgi:hypothetical protein
MRGRRMLNRGRALAVARFTEVIEVFTETLGDPPDGEIDPEVIETPVPVSVPGMEHTDDGIPARVKYSANAVGEREQGDQDAAVQGVEVHFPARTAGVGKNQFARVLSSTVDESMVGRKFRLQGNGSAGQTTALRVPAEEVS